ncbi:hypothetical protein [Pedobacter cryophilus]|jgi:hypothetical protein|uniref:Uncharacterized protein n=1 Tax=Pedobacter cryophilus TaxID=2571271 RepID=A0A4U1BUG8_9SPHI|nr:hypothetical protein [Pedobacter cryophilus]TKB95538.1 hypothetical protein FA046_16180 [Pedobacter cryophilus]
MSLVDQIKYLDSRGGNEILQHTYMSNNINIIANGLRDYVQANYPDIYNNPNNTQEAYIDLCIQGLQGTKVFNHYENNLPIGTPIGTLSSGLVTSIKCP